MRKKLRAVMGLILSGAMVLAMIPAAFADNTVSGTTYQTEAGGKHHVWYADDPTDGGSVDCRYEYTNPDATGYVGVDAEGAQYCICGAEKPAEEVGTQCDHTGVQKCVDNGDGTHNAYCPKCDGLMGENIPCVWNSEGYEDDTCACGSTKPEEVGTTYTPVDATHHHVHAVYEDGTVYDADVDCVFETGTCICGNVKPEEVPTTKTITVHFINTVGDGVEVANAEVEVALDAESFTVTAPEGYQLSEGDDGVYPVMDDVYVSVSEKPEEPVKPSKPSAADIGNGIGVVAIIGMILSWIVSGFMAL